MGPHVKRKHGFLPLPDGTYLPKDWKPPKPSREEAPQSDTGTPDPPGKSETKQRSPPPSPVCCPRPPVPEKPRSRRHTYRPLYVEHMVETVRQHPRAQRYLTPEERYPLPPSLEWSPASSKRGKAERESLPKCAEPQPGCTCSSSAKSERPTSERSLSAPPLSVRPQSSRSSSSPSIIAPQPGRVHNLALPSPPVISIPRSNTPSFPQSARSGTPAPTKTSVYRPFAFEPPPAASPASAQEAGIDRKFMQW